MLPAVRYDYYKTGLNETSAPTPYPSQATERIRR
jgi:hypothetical protein